VNIYVINAILCAAACLGLCFAITGDWRNVRPMWRLVLIAGAIEQAVLLYGCIEAAGSDVPVEARQVLFSLAVGILDLSVLWALVDGWRSGELTMPGPTRRR
jgi:hypothetical protein